MGLQARLKYLDFYEGPIDGSMNDALTRAIRDFKAAYDLEPASDLDEETRDEIEEVHCR